MNKVFIKESYIRNKKLIQNFSYLSILQIFNLVLPLITYPYLIRVLGVETYGLIVYAQAIIGYLLILVGFGFNVSATNDISVYRDDETKLSEIVSSVLIIKFILLVISVILLVIIIELIPLTNNYKILFYLTLWLCLYELIFPVWYFQGIEKMQYITIITLVSRVFFVFMIFLFIKTSDDYLLLPVINGIGALLSGIISIYILFFKHKVKFRFQKMNNLMYYTKKSIPIFLSNISIKLYVSTNKVLIGSFLGLNEVAYYDLGEKVVSIFKLPQGILSQSIFPKISRDKNIAFVKSVFKFSLLFNLGLFLLILLFSKYLVLFLGGHNMLDSISIVNILSVSIPIIAMSNIFGIQVLIPFGKSKVFSKVIILSGFVYLLQLAFLWMFGLINIYSISIITVLTEVFVTMVMFYFCKKYRLW